MPAASAPGTPVAPDIVTGIRAGDERAFETLFRARYDTLLEEARRKLEEKESAPKVVERAFTKLWDYRAKLDTPESVDAYLHEAVREGAAREAKRKAMAHKMAQWEGAKEGKHGHAQSIAANVDEAWTHVAAVLHAPKVDAQTAEAQAKLGRHHAAEHIGSIAKKKSMVVPITAGVALVLGVLGAFWYAETQMADSAINTAIESAQAVEQKTEIAQRGSLNLDDSTAVLLGPQTTLKVARGFNVENRAVKVTGTASFDVRNAGPPQFKVKAKNALLTANGTKFDVRAYPGDPVLVIRVREGTVEVKLGRKNFRNVTAGQSVVVDSTGTIREPVGKEVDIALGWTDGHVTIEDKTLRVAFPEVLRWYGLHLATIEPSHLDRKVTISVPLDSVQRAIDAIASSSGLAFGYSASNMIFYDPKNKPKGVR